MNPSATARKSPACRFRPCRCTSTGMPSASPPCKRRSTNDGSVNVMFTDIEEGARYALSLEGGNLLLKQRETDLLIQWVELQDRKPEDAATSILPILKHVAQWERSLALQNLRTQMDPSLVDFVFAEQLDNGTEHVYPTAEIILDYAKSGGQWKEIRGKLKARNRTPQTLHMVLAYFSTAYGIHILKNDPIDPGDAYVTLWGDEPKRLLLPGRRGQRVDRALQADRQHREGR